MSNKGSWKRNSHEDGDSGSKVHSRYRSPWQWSALQQSTLRPYAQRKILKTGPLRPRNGPVPPPGSTRLRNVLQNLLPAGRPRSPCRIVRPLAFLSVHRTLAFFIARNTATPYKEIYGKSPVCGWSRWLGGGKKGRSRRSKRQNKPESRGFTIFGGLPVRWKNR